MSVTFTRETALTLAAEYAAKAHDGMTTRYYQTPTQVETIDRNREMAEMFIRLATAMTPPLTVVKDEMTEVDARTQAKIYDREREALFGR